MFLSALTSSCLSSNIFLAFRLGELDLSCLCLEWLFERSLMKPDFLYKGNDGSCQCVYSFVCFLLETQLQVCLLEISYCHVALCSPPESIWSISFLWHWSSLNKTNAANGCAHPWVILDHLSGDCLVSAVLLVPVFFHSISVLWWSCVPGALFTLWSSISPTETP